MLMKWGGQSTQAEGRPAAEIARELNGMNNDAGKKRKALMFWGGPSMRALPKTLIALRAFEFAPEASDLTQDGQTHPAASDHPPTRRLTPACGFESARLGKQGRRSS